MTMGIMEQLTHSTVRIESLLPNGGISSGTGFFVRLLDDGEKHLPVIVTNKHVIAGAPFGRLRFTLALPEGGPDVGRYETVEVVGFEERWIPHPDPDVDLAVLPITSIRQEITARTGRGCFYLTLAAGDIATAAERVEYSAMEDIVMIGYPSGIWDDVNNLPVIRRGITATHVKNRWRGRDEFVTDIASFPGSSGSPVLLANLGSYVGPEGGLIAGSRVKLLGVHYAGFMHQADGKIVMAPVPTDNRPISVTAIPNNLGIAVNALRILDFEPILKGMLRAG